MQIAGSVKGTNASGGSSGREKKYVGKGERESMGMLHGSYITWKVSPWGREARREPTSKVAAFEVGTPSSRGTSKQEPPRHDDRSLRTPPSINHPSVVVRCGPQSADWKLRYSPILPPSPLGPHLAMRAALLEDRMLDSVDSCGLKVLLVLLKVAGTMQTPHANAPYVLRPPGAP